MGGYMIGQYEGIPFRYSWPRFPIGHLVQVQNRGTMQGFARVPYLFLLGDPRISFQEGPPYSEVDDRMNGEVRILSITGAPAGFIPVRIAGGAKYSFVEIPGVTSASERDPFYNGRLQMVNMRDDKYVLFEHGGGGVSLLLHPRPPWYWKILDSLLDALDNTLVFSPQTGATIISLAIAGVALVIVVSFILRKRRPVWFLLPIVVTGFCFAALCGVYAFARLDDVTVTSKTIGFSPWFLVVVFLLTGNAALMYLSTRSRIQRVVAVLIATFPFWAGVVFAFAVIFAFNVYTARQGIGVFLFNYAIAFMFLISFVIYVILIVLVFRTIHKCITREKRYL